MENDTWSKRFKDWGALFVTAAVFILLSVGLIIAAEVSNPTPAFSNLMETIKLLAVACASYWVGSSNNGQRKDEIIAQQSQALATSTPATITTTTAETGAGNVKTVTEPKSEIAIEPNSKE